jgi:hypothetical protein
MLNRQFMPSSPLLAVYISISTLFGAACAGGSGSSPEQADQKQSLRTEGKQVFANHDAPGGSGSSGTWSIILAAFRGENQEPIARDALKRIQTESGLGDAYLERRGEGLVVALGRYPDASDPRAQKDLERVKAALLDGERLYAGSYIAPPYTGAVKGAAGAGDYDLRRAREGFGKNEALYTLQVGHYGFARGDPRKPSAAELAEFRKAAEDAATILRREGELAFFYHGPNGSDVTVGLFGTKDYDPLKPGLESPQLQLARQRFPYNLLNGRPYRERVKGVPENSPKAWRTIPSGLVNTPKP